MLKEYLSYYRPYKFTALGVVLGSAAAAGLDLYFPYLVRRVLNVELPQRDMENLLLWLGLLFLLYCANFVLLYFVNYCGRGMSAAIENDMRRALFQHLENMSFSFFDNSKTGQLLSRLIGDIVEISELTFRGLNDIMTCSIIMVGTIVMMLWMNPYLASVICFLLIFKTIHTVIVNRRMKRAFRANRSCSGEVAAQADETLGGIRLVKAFAQEEQELERFMEKSDALYRSRRKSYKLFAYFTSSISYFTQITNVALLGCGSLLMTQEMLSFSDFVAFLLYANLFMRPLFRLTMFTEMYQKGMAGFHRYLEIMQEPESITDLPEALPCRDIKGEIVFEDVTFSYREEHQVLEHFNLVIKPGEKVAFVGATGAGKTTLASLLLRFYEPEQGRILLDGIDIKNFQQRSLRQQIGLVQQDVFLFSDSVSYNIAYGRRKATQAEIERAAQLAAAHDFITALPQGYDTCVGERGVKLSGGQKQRVAIARAFLKNPPVLVLDEATSALDVQTELQIQASLDRLAENRTTLIIAHRLSTIKNADRIVVLDKGGIAEMGTHAELLAHGEIYKNLYNAGKNNKNIKSMTDL